jgi:hypothetical protein
MITQQEINSIDHVHDTRIATGMLKREDKRAIDLRRASMNLIIAKGKQVEK